MDNPYLQLKHLSETRKSCRKFKPDEIPQDITDKILSVAANSPYAGGSRSWGVTTVKETAVKERLVLAIQEKVRATAESMERESADLFVKYSQNFMFFREAPLLIIPYFKVTPVMKSLLRESITESLLQWERDNSVKSISCVSMLILLAAESLGLGACYMTGPLIAEREISEILNIPPGREVGAIIPIGYKL